MPLRYAPALIVATFSLTLLGCHSPIWLAPDARLPDGSVYQGDAKDGLFEGDGKQLYKTGEYYQGEFSRGLYEGKGEIVAEDWSYSGTFSQGLLHGEGTLRSNNGVYVGEFAEDDYNGHGVFTYPNGDSIEGEFKDGEPVAGISLSSEGRGRYEGEFKDWEWNGSGVYEIADEYRYEAEFEDGAPINGTFIDGDDVYEGEFDDWDYHGEGVFHSGTEYSYIGEFKYGYFDGKGVIENEDGSRIEGMFSYGRPSGTVQYTTQSEDTGKKITRTGTWIDDEFVEEGQPTPRETQQAVTEKILYGDGERLTLALQSLPPQRPGVQDVYFLIVGGDGEDEVFPRDVAVAQSALESHFAVGDRGVVLLNSKGYERYPLATVTSIERAVAHLGEVMDPDEDVLFVHLASHGGRRGNFSLAQPGISLADLMPDTFRQMLDQAGIRHQVVVVSACYSGQWQESLATENNIIMMSARSDRTSFGCGDASDMTWFTRAVYRDGALALNDPQAFFSTVASFIETWETEEGFEEDRRSEPQFHLGDKFIGLLMEEVLGEIDTASAELPAGAP